MFDVYLVVVLTSMACGILGPFIVLRNLSMTADALSHSVMLGIVIAFLFVKDLASPFLTVGAAVFGVLTVYFVELLYKNRLVKKNDALGIVYPMFFSIAVIIISKWFRNVHLDVDMVLMGNPLFAPFIRLLGLPRSAVIMGLIFLINLAFVFVFYRPLSISTFDEEYAKVSGIKVGLLYFVLMTLVSLTSVTAFDSVGAILVISLFVTPTVTAVLLSKSLKICILLTLLVGIFNVSLGFILAIWINVSITGMCAFVGMLTALITILWKRRKPVIIR